MIFWSFICFSVALASGLIGFGGAATSVASLAQILFFVFFSISVALIAAKLVRDHADGRFTDAD